MAGNKTKTRRFSYTSPIMFQGSYYPTAEWDIQSDTGEVNPTTVFADAKGSYYTLDNNGSAIPVMPFHNLDEVNVTAPKKQDVSANAFSRYLTMSNDNTQVNNLPHREYNTHLKENAEKGAKEHALWEKEHPNLTAWGEIAGAIPFGVASIPLIAGTGQTLLGTAAGQAVKSGVTKALANPLIEDANGAIGLGFAGKGVHDISQGKFTPETALDLMGLPIGVKAEINIAKGLKRNGFNLGKYITNESSIPRSLKKEGAKRYMDFIQSSEYENRLKNAGLENHWQDMKDLANKRLNGIGYFPGRMQKTIKGNPNTFGLSTVDSYSPYYGITLKQSLYPNRVMPTLDHEIAHWATKNAGIEDKGFLGDIMRYNESISPNKPWEDVLREELKAKPNMTIDEAEQLEESYNYLIDPQEKRARAMAIIQQAKDLNKTPDEFVDMWGAPNGKFFNFAPEQLKDMSMVFTKDNLKKYLNKFLGISAPVGVGTTLMYNQNQQNYDK